MRAPVDGEKRAALVRSRWESEDGGSSLTLLFAGVQMRLSTLALLIIGTILIGAPFGVALIFVFNDIAHIPARGASVLAGTLIGIPLTVLLMLIVRRRTRACVIAFGRDALHLDLDGVERTVAYQDLALLRWVCDTEYARIVLGADGGVFLSVLAGIAKVPRGHSPALPALPAHVIQRLEEAGLSAEKGRRPGVLTFRPASDATRGT